MKRNQAIYSSFLAGLFCIVALLSLPGKLQAQQKFDPEPLPEKYFRYINPERLIMNIRDLASPAFEGREMGTYGNTKAANWVEYKFRDFGLKGYFTEQNSYTQSFPITRYALGDTNMFSTPDTTFSLHDDFVPAYFSATDTVQSSIVFAGMGTAREFLKVDAEDRVALVFQSKLDSSHTYLPKFDKQVANAKDAGVSALVLMAPPNHYQSYPQTGGTYRFEPFIDLPVRARKDLQNTPRPYIKPESRDIPAVFVSAGVGQYLFEKAEPDASYPYSYDQLLNGESQHWSSDYKISIMTHVKKDIETTAQNVAAVLDGSMPMGRGYVLVSAKFDQEGQHPVDGTPFFGANRNASGISAMLEMAYIFTKMSEQPRFPIIFAAFNGGERDAVGPRVFSNDSSFFPQNIIAEISLNELAGGTRSDTSTVFIEGVASDHPLYELARKSADYLDLKIKPRKPGSDLVYDESITPFLRKEIPSLSISGGDYSLGNRIMDSPDKLNYVQLYKITHFAMDLTWRLSTLTQPLPRLTDQSNQSK